MNGEVLKLKREINESTFYSEAINTLRTNIQFCGSSIRAIMFTSSVPDEGKSDITFAVARSFTQIGKRVLFVDADIRKSVIAARYNVNGEIYGLSQYLSAQKSLKDIIYKTDVDGMDIIFAGPYSPNPTELLEEDLFGEIFKYGKSAYDYIVVDTPPMASLIDGAIISKNCDGAIMVVESGQVSYRVEQKVRNQLKNSGCRILGVVLNKVDMKASKYYYKYGKYYNTYKYGYGYSKKSSSQKTKKFKIFNK